ncbi:MAG TPA: hypothetical protein VFR15_07585 [Chloroflexia bacterium]|nr:hypothetical protein [Chloroflexia bacterium]
MTSRLIFGVLLALIGILYLWLAWMSVAPLLQSGDIASYLMTLLFLAAGVVAALAGVNLVRPKRR